MLWLWLVKEQYKQTLSAKEESNAKTSLEFLFEVAMNVIQMGNQEKTKAAPKVLEIIEEEEEYMEEEEEEVSKKNKKNKKSNKVLPQEVQEVQEVQETQEIQEIKETPKKQHLSSESMLPSPILQPRHSSICSPILEGRNNNEPDSFFDEPEF